MNYTHFSRTKKRAAVIAVLLLGLTGGFVALAKRDFSQGTAFPLVAATKSNAAAAPLAPFATITVTTLTDEDGTNNAACSLREALTAANTNAAYGGCSAGTGNDIIAFQVGLTGTITLTAGNGPLQTAFSGGDLTITGPGASLLTVSGGNAIRVLDVDLSNNQQVVISGLTIAQGSAPGGTFQAGGITSSTGNGGTGKLTLNSCVLSGHTANGAVTAAISSLHNLELNDCTLSNNNGNGNGLRGGALYHGGGTLLINTSTIANNTSNGEGGGLGIWGTATINRSTIRNNTATGAGGGLANRGAVTLSGCAIYDNTGADGGGLSGISATLQMTNCTVTGNNSTTGFGDGLYLDAVTTTLKHCTIVRNDQATGGNTAINYVGGTLTLQNNIIALQNNGIFNGLANGAVNSLGNNLISSFGGVIAGLPGPNDLIGIDPQLGELGNNGGPTLTIAPLLGSVVLDKGAASAPTINTDQRGAGFTRPIDHPAIPNGPGSNGSDIGAYELEEGPNFPCDKKLYYAQGDDGQPTQLYAVAFDNNNQTYGLMQIGVNNLNVEYNAIGFRAQSGYLHATEAPPLIAGTRAAPRIFLIDATGGLADMGVPAGLPGGPNKYLTGAMGPDGFYYIRQQNQNTLYRIDVSGFPATLAGSVAIAGGGVGDDWAWNLANGLLYTVTNNGDLRGINPATGANTLIVGGAFPNGGPYGAVWLNAAGQVFALRNSNGAGLGEIWLLDPFIGGGAGFVANGAEGSFNDGCACLNAPYLAKTFDNFSMNVGQTNTLTFRVVNGPTAQTVTFTDPLPASLRFVPGTLTPASPFGGTVNAYGNTQLLTITGMNLPALTDMTFTVQVQALSAGGYNNQAILSGTTSYPPNTTSFFIPSDDEGDSIFCNATRLNVDPSLSINSVCIQPGLARVIITANNPAGVGALNNLAINGFLFGGLALAPTPNLFNNCGGTVTGATAGSTSYALTGGALAAGVSSCRIEVDVLANTPGSFNMSTNGTASLGGTTLTLGGLVPGVVDVVVPPTLSKAFNPTMINPGGVSQLTLTLNNLAGNKQIDSLAFTDNFPAGMTVAATPGLTNTCGGAVTGATANSNSISLANGSLAAGATSCQITVNVTSTTPGAALNTINNLTGTAVGAVVACPALTAAPASATLTVGCPAIDTTITAPAAVCAGSTGNTASVPDAGMGASYAWTITNGTITSAANIRNITWTANSTSPVTLNVTVTPTPGCSAMGTQQVTVNPLPNATITAPAAVCVNSTGNTASVPDAGLGATYNWMVNNGTITAGQGTRTITFSVGNSAPVGLSVDVTNGSGCNNASSVPVNLNPLPTANAGAPQTLCELNPGPTVFALSGSVTNGTPQWNVFASTGTANASIVSPNSAATSVNVTGTGTVTLRLTATSNTTPACGTATSDVVLTVNPLPVTAITAPASVCLNSTGNTASVPDAGLGATYAWTITNGTITSAANTRNITWTAGATSPATLSVTVTTGAGCAANNSTQVTLLANPSANAGLDQTLCQLVPGPTVFALNGTANGGTPAWTVQSSTGTANASIVSPSAAATNVNVTGIGTVTLRLTVSGSCGTATDDVVLTVNPNPAAAAGPDQSLCQVIGGPTAFILNGTAANGTPQWSVLGTTGTATAAILTPGNVNTGVNVTGTGTVTLRLTVTSNATPSCGTATDDVVLTVNPLPSATITAPATVCALSTGNTASVPDAGVGATYAWTITNGTLTSAANVRNITWTAGSTSPVTLNVTVTTGAGCSANGAQQVTINQNPTANAGADQTLCQAAGGPTAFTLNGIVTDGTPQWSVQSSTGTANATIVTANAATTGVNITGTGTVTLRLTTTSNATPSCGTATDDVLLTVNPNPTANAGADQTLCQTVGGPTAFTVNGTATNGTPQWSVQSSTGTANASILTPNAASTGVNVTGTGTVTLRLTTTSNATPSCGTATDDVVLTVNANPLANAGADQALCQTTGGPTAFTLNGTATNGTLQWSVQSSTGTANASILTANAASTGVNVTGTGTVTLRLTTTSNATPSCGTATDDVVLTVNANPTAAAGVDQALCQIAGGPTAFTLNGTVANGTPQWSIVTQTGTANATLVTPNAASTGVNVTGVGTVTLRLTTTSNATPSCGTATDDVVLTVNPLPATTITAPTAVCALSTGNTASVPDAGAGAAYNWTITAGTITAGQGTRSITWTAGATSPVTLNVSITTAASCNASGSQQITINPNPTANAGPDQTLCQAVSGTTAFTLNGALTNGTPQWSVVNSTGSANAVLVTPASATTGVNVTGTGTVTLRLSVTSNTTPACGTATDEVVLTVNPNPSANAGPDQATCQAASGTTGFTLNGAATNGTPQWSVVNATGTAAATIVNPASLTTGVNVTGLGSVTLRLTTTSNATPSCGTATDDVVLSVSLLPGTTITAPVELAATSIGNQASVPDAGVGATYAWTITNGTITTGQGTRAITFTAGASGNVTLNISINTGSCVTTGTAVIPIRRADIRLTQTIAPNTPVKIAQPVSFNFTVTNRGELTATNVTVSNPLPAGFAFVAATPSFGSYNSATGLWSVETLAVGGSATLRIDAGITAFAPYVNTGVATMDQPDINPADNTATVTANLAPPAGPGAPLNPASPPSDDKAGSVLVYNFITSSAANAEQQNTRVSLTNTDGMKSAAVHLFFVDGSTCAVADSYLCLTPLQTASFLMADLDPGTSGYLVAVAVDAGTGCPINFNCLIGDAFVKLSTGHAANLAAEAFAALPGRQPLCDANATSAQLNFDGVMYNAAPRTLAVSNLPDRASGNDTLLVVNRFGGHLATGAQTLGAMFGLLYDDAETPYSFSFASGACQFRSSLSNSFPRTTPRFEQVIPAGRSGWLKLSSGSDAALLGAVLNHNPTSATQSNAFRQGHNLHKLTLTTAATLTIPVFPPSC